MTASHVAFYEAGARLSVEHADACRMLIPQQMDLELFRNNCDHRDKRWVDVFAYGKFPEEDPDKQVIMQSWFARHEAAWNPKAPPAVQAFGLDIAYSSGGDSTCLAAGGQSGVNRLHLWQEPDAMKTIDRVIYLAKEYHGIDLQKGAVPVSVDADGAGYVVANRLVELGVYVNYYHGNARAEVSPESYGNARAENYALLGRRLRPDDLWRDEPWAMPFDQMLREELCAPEKVYQGNDNLRFFITPKNRNPQKENVVSVKEKIHRSPDRGDAVVYLFHAVRILHSLNAWFQQAQRPLTMYPCADDLLARQENSRVHKRSDKGKPDPAEPVPPEILAHLREQYGKFIDKDATTDPEKIPDWRKEYLTDAAANAAAKLRAEKAEIAEKEKAAGPAANEGDKGGEGSEGDISMPQAAPVYLPPAIPLPPEPPSWLDSIRWSD